MERILIRSLIAAIAATLSSPSLFADISFTVPGEFRHVEDISRWVCDGDGHIASHVEVSKQYLEYDVNPTAMKRFLSIEEARVAEFGVEGMSTPRDQKFERKTVYRARIEGSSEDGERRITVLLVGARKQLLVVKIRTYSLSEAAHRSLVSDIEGNVRISEEAQPGATDNPDSAQVQTGKSSSD